jgi:nucleoid DNA-binding protein
MFSSTAFFQSNAATIIAQATPQIDTVRETTLAFSGPQFFTALVSGLFLAFGFQMLLTNLSVATGISVLSFSGNGKSSNSSDGTAHIGTALGVWTLATVSIALFIAAFLAVKLSFVTSALMGATVGLVIWACYFTILVWISSTAAGSLIGSVVGTATKGFQAVFGTATTALGMKAASSEIVSTAEAVAAAVRREMTEYVDPKEVQSSFKSLINKVQSPELNLKGIREEFEKILNDSDLKKLTDTDNLPVVSRETFENLLKERTDLSPRDAKKIIDELDQSWQSAVGGLKKGGGLSGLLKWAKSANPQELLSGNFSQQLGQLAKEMGQGQNPGQFQQGLSALMGIILGRVDLSDLDVEKIKGQLKSAQSQIKSQTDKVTSAVGSQSLSPGAEIIRSDVEHYLLNTYVWQMNSERVEQDFRETLYDPNADARTIRQGIESLSVSDFHQILQSRGMITQSKIAELTAKLERVRLRVLEEVRVAEATEMLKKTQDAANRYLRTTPRERLLSSASAQDFKALLVDSGADPKELHSRLLKLRQDGFLSGLRERTDLTEPEKAQIVGSFEPVIEVAIADTQGLQEGAQARVDAQWQKVQDYLRNTGKSELNPDGIQRDLQTLLDDPQAGLHDLKLRASRFDRDTLVQLLSQNENLSEAQVNDVLDRVESSWNQVAQAPTVLADKAKAQYEDTTSAIADYLRRTGKSELNPDGIKRDLTTLLEDPKTGLELIRDRLSQMDRDTLVQLLSQREDLTEEEANATIDQVQDTIRQVLRTPQRLAVRAQEKAQNFQTALEEYLRHTEKDELNPEGIKRDLSLLFQDPRLGLEQVGDRLSKVDRSTIVALLSQREDISEAEAEQIVDRVLAVRDQMLAQVEAVKLKLQSVIDGILGKIRDYLNSLERPELNYDGIKQDVQTLFDDPNAGLDALRDRLSHFDRGTLVAVMSSRDDISEADANRIIDQVDQVRTNVLHRAERIQEQIQSRLEDLKHQAQAQAEATRKAAATAAWWLFATAFTSGVAAAVAGVLAISTVSS